MSGGVHHAPPYRSSKAASFDDVVLAVGVHNASNSAGSVALTYRNGASDTIFLAADEKLLAPISSIDTGGTLSEANVRSLH